MDIARLPNLDHLGLADYEYVYEPSDDTYLLCDALLADADGIVRARPALVVEIGCGSGAVTAYACQLLAERGGLRPVAVAVDISRHACAAAAATASANGLASHVDVVEADLLGALEGRLQGGVDLLLWNPPYVPTPPEEVCSGKHTPGAAAPLSAAWAGGEAGRDVTNRLLPRLGVSHPPPQPTHTLKYTHTCTFLLCAIVAFCFCSPMRLFSQRLLSKHGRIYIVAVAENDPSDMMECLRAQGLSACIAAERTVPNERLCIIRAMLIEQTKDLAVSDILTSCRHHPHNWATKEFFFQLNFKGERHTNVLEFPRTPRAYCAALGLLSTSAPAPEGHCQPNAAARFLEAEQSLKRTA